MEVRPSNVIVPDVGLVVAVLALAVSLDRVGDDGLVELFIEPGLIRRVTDQCLCGYLRLVNTLSAMNKQSSSSGS